MKKLALASLLALCPSCASIMTGSSDSVTIQSVPSGAHFSTNSGIKGRTPMMVTVPSSQDLIIEFRMAGHEPTTATVQSRPSAWIIGNLVFGGPLGLIIDIVNPDARTHNSNVTATLVESEREPESEDPTRVPEAPRSALAQDFDRRRERMANP